MIRAAALLTALVVPGVISGDYCYNEPHCDPYAWGDLVPACHPLLEVRHSPINLGGQVSRNRSLDSLHLEGFEDIQAGHWTLQNDGHSVILQVGSGMSVSGGGLPDVYHTIQLHFHWGGPATNGSEHTVDRRRYPMEMHIVNMKGVYPNVTAALGDPTGLAVLGVFIDVVYADNVHFGHISRKLSSVAYKGLTLTRRPFVRRSLNVHFHSDSQGQTTKIKPFALLDLLPRHNMSQYYRYYGSLTTPPCSQAVVWTLYEVPVYISWSQLAQFTSQIFSTEEDAEQVTPLQNNFRHVHPTFSRVVSMSKDARRLPASSSHPLRSAGARQLLHVVVLGGFVSRF
ncbi:carbonic anhydrase 15 isoform X1 [Takifugu flavidus]|uniref:carbonic anhydrase 15 isoform X1 n=1 Tax=Takifugu flavidus TaxID=433684 RepID=UPI0025442C4E|nr:carbonic anhydrase 15 isoform X1 [Takifugu flavidus]